MFVLENKGVRKPDKNSNWFKRVVTRHLEEPDETIYEKMGVGVLSKFPDIWWEFVKWGSFLELVMSIVKLFVHFIRENCWAILFKVEKFLFCLSISFEVNLAANKLEKGNNYRRNSIFVSKAAVLMIRIIPTDSNDELPIHIFPFLKPGYSNNELEPNIEKGYHHWKKRNNLELFSFYVLSKSPHEEATHW